jgi:TRAP transporter 4TM/12TM fusion protein
MSEPNRSTPQDEVIVSEEALKKAEEFIEEEEGASNRFGGWLGKALTAAAIVMSLVHLYAAYAIIPAFILRAVHVGFTLALSFFLFPAAKRLRHRLRWYDVVFAVISVGIIAYMMYYGEDFGDRATDPNTLDTILGIALVLLILEAARRTSGWIMPGVVVAFILYALFGPILPAPWTHRGFSVPQLVGHLYMTLEGIFGVAIDVSSTLIILFTIYGAFLQYSGAGKFFIDFSFAAMGGKRSGAGRTVVLASFLLGGPSGSGVATTVTLGSVAYPMLAKAGYGKDAAGGLLAAGGLGAILSPPVLGAAAFLIAEFLKISYLDVILMATIPTILYYLSIFIMVEMDARKFNIQNVAIEKHATAWALTKKYGFHFLSLVAIVIFMLIGFSPVLSVFWATMVSLLMSFLNRDCALLPFKPAAVSIAAALPLSWLAWKLIDPLSANWETVLATALLFGGLAAALWSQMRGEDTELSTRFIKSMEGGSIGVLNVAATCAAAGIIVGVVTLTGLGLKFSSIVLAYADSGSRGLVSLWALFGADKTPELLHDMKLLLTAIFTSAIVWIVGLAVPVTASYIICAVIAAPALILLGVPDFAAHMFIFYYAVLSEVSPPTALSPFAAAAITGGDPYKTTLQSWKYTAPAFLVPFMFVLDDSGQGLLLMGSFKNLANAPWLSIAEVSITAAIGIAALAGGLQGWLFRKASGIERTMLVVAGVLLVYPKALFDILGIGLFALVIAMQLLKKPVMAADLRA